MKNLQLRIASLSIASLALVFCVVAAPAIAQDAPAALTQGAAGLVGRQIYLCHDSQYKPVDDNGQPLTFAPGHNAKLITIKSANAFEEEGGDSETYLPGTGEEQVYDDNGGPIYEVDAVGQMDSVSGKEIKLSIHLQLERMDSVTTASILDQLLSAYAAEDHQPSAAPGAPEADAKCLKGS